jgi:hypothetical protein
MSPENGLGFSHKMSLRAGLTSRGVILSVDDSEVASPEQIRVLTARNEPVRFAGRCRQEMINGLEEHALPMQA